MATVLQTGFGGSSVGRGWLLAVGVLALVLGVVGLAMTLAFMVVDIVWYGGLLIIAGVVQATEAVAVPTGSEESRSRLLRMALGLFYIAAGLYAVFQPAGAGWALTLVLGILLVVSGVFRAAWVLAREGRHSRGLGLVLAVVSAVLGLFILSQWPLSGLWAVGLFVSADLVANGLSWCWAAYSARQR
jgi:uncharacterized membrane protein HdeD (DUF308 family)